MKTVDSRHLGGRHADSASVRTLLHNAGVVAPHTGRDVSEAAVLGIAGGIGSGYSFCPSILRDGLGSGVGVVARNLAVSFDGAFHRRVFEGLNVDARWSESSSPGAARKKLLAELEQGRPVLLWTGKSLPYLEGDPDTRAGCQFAWSVVVHSVDEREERALVGDLGPGTYDVSLDDLDEARAAICSHKLRQVSVTGARKLSASALKKAMNDGLKACIDAQERPRIKTFSLQGLIEWSKVIASPGNKNGWPRCFTEGRIYWALRDLFRSIETRDTGGGLMRPMFADFLEEAAEVTGKARYSECAETYRALGDRWTGLGERALPDDVPAFGELKELYRRQHRAYVEGGPAARAERAEVSAEITEREREVLAAPPLDEGGRLALLEGLREEVLALHDAELAAHEQLAKAVG